MPANISKGYLSFIPLFVFFGWKPSTLLSSRIPAMRLSKEKNQTYILKNKRLSSPFQFDANIIKKSLYCKLKRQIQSFQLRPFCSESYNEKITACFSGPKPHIAKMWKIINKWRIFSPLPLRMTNDKWQLMKKTFSEPSKILIKKLYIIL